MDKILRGDVYPCTRICDRAVDAVYTLRPPTAAKRQNPNLSSTLVDGGTGRVEVRLTPLPSVRIRPVDKIHGREDGCVEHYPYQASG